MNNKTLYLECYSGISGDTTVAALLDLGADQKVLIDGLNSLPIDGYKIEISRKVKRSIEACDFNVILENDMQIFDHKNHHYDDHDCEDHHEHHHDDDHDCENHHEHHHDDDHDCENHHKHPHDHNHLHLGSHEHRNLYDINLIIDQSEITQNAKDIAKKIFYIIAVAESKVHGKPIEEVHFHEVGAIDSIVDIVSTAICLDNLKIHEVVVSELYEGTGQVKCQHGMIPIPVPAVTKIIADYHLPMHLTSVKGELVTPTGAAIIAAIKTKESLPKAYKILKVGLGAGKKEFEHANILRAMLIEDTTSDNTGADMDKVWVLEANIDDCSGEALSAAMEKLFENGAKDVYYTPIYMKKNRPAYMLGVLCEEGIIEKLEETIFTHTTTIGIRRHEALRTTLLREHISVSTPFGDAMVKVCTYKNKQFFYPEYESIKKLCIEAKQDYITVYNLVQSLACNK